MSKEPSFIKIEDIRVLHAKKRGKAEARPKTIRIPAKWTWHYGVLHALRDRLLKDRSDELDAAAQPIEPHSMDVADSATDEFDHDLALTLLSHEQNELYEIDGAIQRIRDGTYGICEESGKPIPEARLRAIPWARYTEEVQASLERAGLGERVRLPRAESTRDSEAIALAESEAPDADAQEIEVHRRTEDEAIHARESEDTEEELLASTAEQPPSTPEEGTALPPVVLPSPISSTRPPRGPILKLTRAKTPAKTSARPIARAKPKSRPATAKRNAKAKAKAKPKTRRPRAAPTRKPKPKRTANRARVTRSRQSRAHRPARSAKPKSGRRDRASRR